MKYNFKDTKYNNPKGSNESGYKMPRIRIFVSILVVFALYSPYRHGDISANIDEIFQFHTDK
jgi:sugar phosphate permease